MKLTLYLIALRQNMTKPPASVCGLSPGGGGAPGYFLGLYVLPGLQIGTPF